MKKNLMICLVCITTAAALIGAVVYFMHGVIGEYMEEEL